MGGFGPTNPSETYFRQGKWMYNGSVWIPVPVLLGYNDRLYDVASDTASGGNDALLSTAVPSGEIWIAEAIAATETGSAPTRIQIGLYTSSSGLIVLKEAQTPVAGVYETVFGPFTLKEGDQARAWFQSTTVDNTLWLRVWGRIIEVD